MKPLFNRTPIILLLFVVKAASAEQGDYFYDLSVGYGHLKFNHTNVYKFRVGNYISDDWNLGLGFSYNNGKELNDDFINYFTGLNYNKIIKNDLLLSYGASIYYSDLDKKMSPEINLKMTKGISSKISIFLEAQAFYAYSYEQRSEVSYLLNLGFSWDLQRNHIVNTIEVDNSIKFDDVLIKDDSSYEVKNNDVILNKNNNLKNVFKKNSSYINNNKELNEIVEYLIDNHQLSVKITNINSYEGDDDYNLWLADRRISRLKNYFISKGISSERIKFENIWNGKLNTKDRLLMFKYLIVE